MSAPSPERVVRDLRELVELARGLAAAYGPLHGAAWDSARGGSLVAVGRSRPAGDPTAQAALDARLVRYRAACRQIARHVRRAREELERAAVAAEGGWWDPREDGRR